MRKIAITVIIVSCLFLGLYSFYQANSPKELLYTDKWIAMGTFVEIISPDKRASHIVLNELTRIEKLLSKYDRDSEIFQLNQKGRIKASPETFYITRRALEFYSLSNGVFDITIGPLSDLWGFTDKDYRVPSELKLKETLKLIGSDKIILREKDNVIQFKLPKMKVDLGAVAKGFAVDCAVKRLKELGIESCLINLGGQVYCLGKKLSKPWRVAVRDPRGKGVSRYLRLTDKAVSTSAEYEQSFKAAAKEYGHIFDPKTGYPVQKELLSVTVVAPDSLTADFLSTTIFALGKDEGEALAKNFDGVEVIIVKR
ncbi:MAG: FAD:protein FMN transferase [Candidatus Omnitrophica bacterium]|nr:FAD:protein FMN transferase [Candidatus Omnitrophota bacterium]